MAEYIPPRKNTAFIFYATLTSRSSRPQMQSNPTLAAGDVTVSSDGAAFANITTLPTVTPAAGKGVKISLSAAEMNADNILVVFSDAAGAEWDDLTILIQTSSVQIADLTPALVWAYASRTLTSFGTLVADIAAAINAVLSQLTPPVLPLIVDGDITRKRGDSWAVSLTIGSFTGYTNLRATIKSNLSTPDSDSVLQTLKNASLANDGLIYVNGAPASDATKGSITVSDASTGAIIWNTDETITALLEPNDYQYDIQAVVGTTVTTLATGRFTISADVTRATA